MLDAARDATPTNTVEKTRAGKKTWGTVRDAANTSMETVLHDIDSSCNRLNDRMEEMNSRHVSGTVGYSSYNWGHTGRQHTSSRFGKTNRNIYKRREDTKKTFIGSRKIEKISVWGEKMSTRETVPCAKFLINWRHFFCDVFILQWRRRQIWTGRCHCAQKTGQSPSSSPSQDDTWKRIKKKNIGGVQSRRSPLRRGPTAGGPAVQAGAVAEDGACFTGPQGFIM